MRRSRWRKLCWFLVVGAYLTLVSLTVRVVLREPCPEERQDISIPTPGPLSPPPMNTDTSHEEESWVLAVRIDWHELRPTGKSANSRALGYVPGHPSVGPCTARFPYRDCVSQRLPLYRLVSDTRHKGCRNMTYLRDLPRTSVVITFTSDHVTVLLRALYSLRHRTPAVLLSEMILVHLPRHTDSVPNDDQRGIEETLHSHFPELIFLRCPADQGLPGARIMGARRALGDVIVFLQMPFEVNVNWLPPLLEPIAEDKDAVTCPVLDVIVPETFAYKVGITPNGIRKGFNWRFGPVNFKRWKTDEKRLHLPFTSPIVEERAFAVHKSRFLDLHDSGSSLTPLGKGMDIEFSLKTWLCGGQIVITPCSRVGIIPSPRRTAVTMADNRNFRSIASGWMEDFGKFVLTENDRRVNPPDQNNTDALYAQERLICKPFRWFLEKVMPELVEKFPPYVPSPGLGVIQSNLCRKCASVTDMKEETSLISLHPCSDPHSNSNYHLHLMNDSHIRLQDGTVCISLTRFGGVVYSACSDMDRNQIWVYNTTSNVLKNQQTDRCLEATGTCNHAHFPRCYQRIKSSRAWLIAKHKSQLQPAFNNNVSTTQRPTLRQRRIIL